MVLSFKLAGWCTAASLAMLAAVLLLGAPEPQGLARRLLALEVGYAEAPEHVGYFLRSIDATSLPASGHVALKAEDAAALEGVSHYRLLPGIFPKGMNFHFDGLATVLKFEFAEGKLTYTARAYQSDAQKDYGSCIFIGTGTGPTLGTHPCLSNPVVNLLPIDGQLWLTIDTSLWGRVDPTTLNTLADSVKVPSTVLNAHPACDLGSGDCFVQYNCGPNRLPLTNQACIGILQTKEQDMDVHEVSRATMPKNMMIQHSHSPCVTPGFVVSKLDSFVARNPFNGNSGMLKYVRQAEDNLWMVMDRKTNTSRILKSNSTFVNNHFWNCFESAGNIIVDSVAATEDYLDNYFSSNLDKPRAEWDKLFHPAMRCRVPLVGEGEILCEPFFKGAAGGGPRFDYPTYNPLFKMNPKYQFFYAIAAKASSSRWFDQLIKVDAQDQTVSKQWSSDGVFLTEADFIRRQSYSGAKAEDDGILVSVLYNATADRSSVGLFDAASLELLSQYDLGFVVPFHAHGIVCEPSKPCYPNP